MPALAAEGGDARSLARLASRLARANAAVEVLADGAERYLALRDRAVGRGDGFDARSFDAAALSPRLPEEIRLRLLLRAIDRVGHEGPAELGKVESPAGGAGPGRAKSGSGPARPRLKQTLAGALVSLAGGRIRIEPAPPRRGRTDDACRSGGDRCGALTTSRKTPIQAAII